MKEYEGLLPKDPVLAFITIIFFLFLAGAFLLMAGIIALPAILAFIGYQAYKWHKLQPVPTHEIYTAADHNERIAHFPDTETFKNAHTKRILDALDDELPSYEIFSNWLEAVERLYEGEDLVNPLPPLPDEIAGTVDEGRYRDKLHRRMKKTQHPDTTLALINNAISKAFLDFTKHLPAQARVTREQYLEQMEGTETPLFTVALVDAQNEPGKQVWRLMSPFLDRELIEHDIFTDVCRQIMENVSNASGGEGKESILPEEYKGTPRQMVIKYLDKTPLIYPFIADVPVEVPDRDLLEHCMICAGAGWGKTQLLEALIYSFINREDPPSLIIVDSQGQMLNRIRNLAIFDPDTGKHKDRLIIIDPETDSPALNMFDLSGLGYEKYTGNTREQIENEIISLFNYVFAAIASELTTKQGTAFSFIVRLMLSRPGSSIHTVLELMEEKKNGAPVVNIDDSVFKPDIEKLDRTAQDFFKNQFFNKSLIPTRQQIAARLYSVLAQPAFNRMFSGSNKLNMYEAMQAGKIVLVNTTKNLLKNEASALFGRYMIARVLSAAFDRAPLLAKNPAAIKPAFLIVDEASDYFDDNTDMLLKQARKFKLGVIMAFQYLEQLSQSLRSGAFSNTTVKIAGGVNHMDARLLANNMGLISTEVIRNLKKSGSGTQFALYIRSSTDQAIAVKLGFGILDAQPTIDDDGIVRLLEQNRLRIGVPTALSKPAEEPEVPHAAGPDEPIVTPPPSEQEQPSKRNRDNPHMPRDESPTF